MGLESFRYRERVNISMTERQETMLGLLKGPNGPYLKTREGKERGSQRKKQDSTGLESVSTFRGDTDGGDPDVTHSGLLTYRYPECVPGDIDDGTIVDRYK